MRLALLAVVLAGCGSHYRIPRSTAMSLAREAVTREYGWGGDPSARFRFAGTPIRGLEYAIHAQAPVGRDDADLMLYVSERGEVTLMSANR